MPDLTNKDTHEFWHEYPDPSIYKVISFMEGVENWTIDGDPKIEEAIEKLGTVLDDIGNIDLQEEDKFIQILSSIKMGRSLRILQCLNTAYPGAASKILIYAESSSTQDRSDAAKLFLRRNIVFERMRLLGRIFSEDRLATIAKILENKGNYE